MSDENIGFVRGLYEAFNKGDVEAVLGAFDENIEWYEAEGMPHGGLHRGPQAVAENVFQPLANDIENFNVKPEEFYADGDEVVVISMYTGTWPRAATSSRSPASTRGRSATARSRACASSRTRRSTSKRLA